MDLLLKGLKWQRGNQQFDGDIRIHQDTITQIDYNLSPKKKEHVIYFNDHFVYPGLINAHDHLEMNVYPNLPTQTVGLEAMRFGNYVEWSRHIYKPAESPIREIEKVNLEDRLRWGGIKNLISGVTTVVHHNPWHKILASESYPVKVLRDYSWSHSLAFGKDAVKAFHEKPGLPFVIHAAEGVDELALNEVSQLFELGLLKSNTVLIHAIALSQSDQGKIINSGASIVWCPSSNFFLFDKTAPISAIKSKVKIALGTDSTLTGYATLFDEMKMAMKTTWVTAEEIFLQVTATAARIFKIPKPEIAVGSLADLIVLPKYTEGYYENLVQANSSQLELVLINGKPRMGSELLTDIFKYEKNIARISGVRKRFYCDINSIMNEIEKKVGRTVEQNSLWRVFH